MIGGKESHNCASPRGICAVAIDAGALHAITPSSPVARCNIERRPRIFWARLARGGETRRRRTGAAALAAATSGTMTRWDCIGKRLRCRSADDPRWPLPAQVAIIIEIREKLNGLPYEMAASDAYQKSRLRRAGRRDASTTMTAAELAKLIDGLGILVVDKNAYMRRLTRMMLMAIGARSVYEVGDGLAALHVVRHANPDVMLLDWDMPFINGPQIIHIVRSPGLFAKPAMPIIMLTESTRRSQVREAMRLGVNEFLVKPTSPKALHDRLAYILLRPRPMVKIGKYYVPEPRQLAVQARTRRRA